MAGLGWLGWLGWLRLVSLLIAHTGWTSLHKTFLRDSFLFRQHQTLPIPLHGQYLTQGPNQGPAGVRRPLFFFFFFVVLVDFLFSTW
jgi:hypothetical protein